MVPRTAATAACARGRAIPASRSRAARAAARTAIRRPPRRRAPGPSWPGRSAPTTRSPAPSASGAAASRRPPGVVPPCQTAGMTPTSVLSDGTIRRLVEEGRIRIAPWDARMVQPASVDLRLGRSFRVFHNHRITAVDLGHPPAELTEQVTIEDGGTFVIHPGEFCLGATEEWVELPDDLVARIEGKSSLGRLGLVVHATAGFCDPGFQGTLTLELANFNSVPIILRPGLPIAQLSFMTLDRPAERPYGDPALGSHYAGQVEATESRYEGGPGTAAAAANGSTVG